MGVSGAPRSRPAAGRRRATKGAKTTPGLAARRAALLILEESLNPAAILSERLEAGLARASLAPADAAFVRALVLGTLRRRRGLEAALGRLVERPLPARHARVHLVLLIGLAQLLLFDTPPHAAVTTAVALVQAGKGASRPLAGLVNAVLRRAVDERDRLAPLVAPRPENVLPPWIEERWRTRFGETALERIARVVAIPPPIDLTLKPGVDGRSLAERLKAEVLPTGSLRLAPGTRVERLEGFRQGKFWVQDAAAMLPVRLLLTALETCGGVGAGPVIDLAAAPGGKTMQLAAAGVRVQALDRSRSRLERLRENLARTRLSAELLVGDAQHPPFAPGSASAVLLDAPCSATGTLRRHPDLGWKRGPDDIARLAERQRRMLEAAAGLVAQGGVLVYCVCSLEPEEGVGQVEEFLAKHREFARLPVREAELPGLAEARTPSGDVLTHPGIWAGRGGIDGFHVSRLVRRQD
ncbi:MAG: methyltransferase domain-containing protein [Alphaproteobacteria bacterium]|nr:MAG: methyltransferase domain-containing protein [Alphaproteobacteria bacterium]